MNKELKLYENKFTLPVDAEVIKNHIENLSIDDITHEIVLLITYLKTYYENKI